MASILIIEDEVIFAEYLRLVLEGLGHEVTSASGGIVGLEMLEDRLFDLVITDIVMSDGEGIETVIQIHKTLPRQQIIAISAHKNYVVSAKKLGATCALLKPFGVREFVAVVQDVIDGKFATLANPG